MMHTLESPQLSSLFSFLQQQGYRLIGPTVRDGAVVFDHIESVEQLPRGVEDEQGTSTYALRKNGDDFFFRHVLGPVTWKKFLFPPRARLFSARRNGKSLEMIPPPRGENPPEEKMAFVGVRPCEIQALALHDKVFMENGSEDPSYTIRRKQSFVVAVNCTRPGGNCFCVSMKSGPRAEKGFDIALTEMRTGDRYWFAVETGSRRGEAAVAGLGCREADAEEEHEVERVMTEAEHSIAKSVDMTDVKVRLTDAFEHVAWEKIAQRCMACANCTMVCPTCFCSTVEDTTDLTGTTASRWRRWDSCFTMDFTKVAGGNVRTSRRSRYRQWLMHKFVYWVDQFGAPGCVGCGRCITWCPAGIDITEEVARLQGAPITTTVP